ncbi:hypothetical protein BH09PSE5_BH09PSE5_00520 [soil metagenome]
MRVVVADPMHEAGIDMLRELHDVRLFKADEADACAQAVLDADAVVVRTFKFDELLLERCTRLQAVVKHGAGVDNIDVDAATRLGIVVANSGDANAQSVAEASVTLMLAALRHVPEMHRVVTEGRYAERWNVLLEGVGAKTLGIIGFGNIGRRVARMCAAGFDMNVLAFDPKVDAGTMSAAGVRKAVSLESLLEQSDVVSIHASLGASARCLLGREQIALMKPTAVLVNTARGGIVDEQALAEALRENRIWAAGLDVLEQEPPMLDNPLLALSNVVLMPHVGGATEATRRLMATRSASAVIAVLDGRRPDYLLNVESWSKRRHGAGSA